MPALGRLASKPSGTQALPNSVSYDAALTLRAIALGREGRSRAEIAVELGVSLENLAAWACEHPEFSDALERADTESRAWWDKLPREAVWKDGVFHAAVWSRAMVQRFGSLAHRTPPDATDPQAPQRPRVRIEIPRNGREARRRAPKRAGD